MKSPERERLGARSGKSDAADSGPSSGLWNRTEGEVIWEITQGVLEEMMYFKETRESFGYKQAVPMIGRETLRKRP
jgi:hypothetical protein